MASVGALWVPATLRVLRVAATNATRVVRTQLAGAAKPFPGELQHVPIRAGRQPVHPTAFLKQQKRGFRWISGATARNIDHAVRRFMTGSSGQNAGRVHRSQLPASNTSRRVGQFSGRAPFASALRPNLTGGAMPRTAGGYTLGGGARYFSHTPVAPAQVIQNVSQAMRAFCLSGQKLRYEGTGPYGERQYRSVSKVEDDAMSKFQQAAHFAPGSYIDFPLGPTVTALSPLSPLAAAISEASEASGFKSQKTAAGASLNTDGFLDVLSADFSRALRDLAAVSADLRRLSVLGDLPVQLEKGNVLRVRFPGVDASYVERLCDDIGVQRGMVGEDIEFDVAAGVPVALKFPFAPDMDRTLTSPGGSLRSLRSPAFDDDDLSMDEDSFLREAFAEEADNPWLSEVDGTDSLSPPQTSTAYRSDEFEGLEGIYRFLEECDRPKGRFQ